MKKLFAMSAVILALTAIGRAQEPDVVKISTNLIQLDVTVTDQKGKPIRDLRADEFEIFENGQKQSISNFSFVSKEREKEIAPKPIDNVAVPVPPVELRPDSVRRTIAIVVDDLSLSFESAYQVRRALKNYVDNQMRDGDLVAIIRTSAGVGALQQFTSNREQLYAAIEKVKWFPLGRGNIGAFAPIEPTPLELARASGDSTITDEDLEEERNFLNGVDDFRDSTFAVGTLGALRFLIRGMSELPGRKSVILFSDGIRLFPRDTDGGSDGGAVFDFMRELVDQANRASIVFYTIDARGLVTTSITAQDRIVSPSPQALSQVISSRSRELLDTQEGLSFLAKETGGLAVINNNSLSEGVGRVLDDQSYYLIGYVPDDDTFDKEKRKFNKLEIRVTRPGAKVRYRSGFINVATDEKPKIPTTMTPVQAIQSALTSPFTLNALSLRLNTLFGYDEKQGTYVRSLVHVNGKDLTFTDEPDGVKKAVFDLLAVSFGDDGSPVDQIAKTYTIRVNQRIYEKIRNEGFVYHFTFPVKKPGAYQYRVAIRDSQSDKLGSASQFIQVPNLKKNRVTVSGIVLENFTPQQWNNSFAEVPDPKIETTDPMEDTSTRTFKRGSILRYGFEVYNAKLDPSNKPNISTQIRVFRERQPVLEGKRIPLDHSGQTDFRKLKSVGAFSLATKMEPGDYVLQIIVFDNLAKEKSRIATRYIQFEVVD